MSVTEPDENELGDGLADLERRRRAELVQRGLRVAAERGFYIFASAPYGYRKIAVSDRGTTHYKLEPDPQTVGTVQRIFNARLQGATERGHRATTELGRHPVSHGPSVDHRSGASHLEQRSLLRHQLGQQTSHEQPRNCGQGAKRVPSNNLPGRVRPGAEHEGDGQFMTGFFIAKTEAPQPADSSRMPAIPSALVA